MFRPASNQQFSFVRSVCDICGVVSQQQVDTKHVQAETFRKEFYCRALLPLLSRTQTTNMSARIYLLILFLRALKPERPRRRSIKNSVMDSLYVQHNPDLHPNYFLHSNKHSVVVDCWYVLRNKTKTDEELFFFFFVSDLLRCFSFRRETGRLY